MYRKFRQVDNNVDHLYLRQDAIAVTSAMQGNRLDRLEGRLDKLERRRYVVKLIALCAVVVAIVLLVVVSSAPNVPGLPPNESNDNWTPMWAMSPSSWPVVTVKSTTHALGRPNEN